MSLLFLSLLTCLHCYHYKKERKLHNKLQVQNEISRRNAAICQAVLGASQTTYHENVTVKDASGPNDTQQNNDRNQDFTQVDLNSPCATPKHISQQEITDNYSNSKKSFGVESSSTYDVGQNPLYYLGMNGVATQSTFNEMQNARQILEMRGFNEQQFNKYSLGMNGSLGDVCYEQTNQRESLASKSRLSQFGQRISKTFQRISKAIVLRESSQVDINQDYEYKEAQFQETINNQVNESQIQNDEEEFKEDEVNQEDQEKEEHKHQL